MKNWNYIVVWLFAVISPLSVVSQEQQKVILVLGSGGSRALAHVGVIEELEKLGIIPDIIVGSSSGAVVGALYAQYRDITKVKDLLIDLKYDDLIDFTFFQKYALSSREKLEQFLNKNLTVTDFSSLQIQFIAVATDLHKGEPVYLKEGKLHSAVLASAALPILFPPYKTEETLYVDGGVSDPLPVQFAKTLGNGVIIASDISPALDGFDTENLLQVVRKSFEVMYQRLASFAREKADVLLEMEFRDIDSPINDENNHQSYERGREVVRNCSEKLLQKVPHSR